MEEIKDRDYYLARAAVSRSLANQSKDPQVAMIHAELARKYLEAANVDETNTLRIRE